MQHPVSWLSCLYIIGAVTTFFTGSPTHLDLSSLNATVDTTQRVMSAIIWPFYWPMRWSWAATHSWDIA